MNKYFCSFASGNLSFLIGAGCFSITGTVGKCDLIRGDNFYVVTTNGRMIYDKLYDVQADQEQLVFEKYGVQPVKFLTFIGRDDD